MRIRRKHILDAGWEWHPHNLSPWHVNIFWFRILIQRSDIHVQHSPTQILESIICSMFSLPKHQKSMQIQENSEFSKDSIAMSAATRRSSPLETSDWWRGRSCCSPRAAEPPRAPLEPRNSQARQGLLQPPLGGSGFTQNNGGQVSVNYPAKWVSFKTIMNYHKLTSGKLT